MHNNMVFDSSYPLDIVIIELFLLLDSYSYSHLQAMFQKILAPGFDTICTDPGSKLVKNVKSLMEEQNNNKNKLWYLISEAFWHKNDFSIGFSNILLVEHSCTYEVT
jgi:hypothetical protein